MKLFSKASVIELAHQKAKVLGIALPGDSDKPVIKRAPSPLFHEENPRHAPNLPVTKLLEYTPPYPVNPEDPPPETIIWKGEAIADNVELKDACFMYLVRQLPLRVAYGETLMLGHRWSRRIWRISLLVTQSGWTQNLLPVAQ